MKHKATFLFSLLFLLAAVHTVSATSVLPIRDSSLADQAAVIAEGTVTWAGPAIGTARPATEYRLRVERLVKGEVQGDFLTVRVAGGKAANGRELKIWGAPEFRIGERALLFLVENRDGSYGPLHLALGTFHELRSEGRRLAVRDLSEVYEVEAAESSEGVRDLQRFGSWLADRAAGVEREADYFVAAPKMEVAWEAFSYLGGIKHRWLEFDRGQDVRWKAHAAGQVGLAGGGFAEFQAALNAWNNDAATNIRYIYDGTTTATGGFDHQDGINAILFHDVHDEAPGSFSCPTPGRGEGVLAIGGVWSDQSGPTPRPIPEGDIVINDNAICWFITGKRAEQVYGHELGHTLGLGHSCGGAGQPCGNGSDKDEALMRASAHNDERGAALGSDDRAGIASLYGTGNPNKPLAPSNLEAEGLSRSVRLTWDDNSTNETQFVIEVKQGKKFKVARSVQKNVTTVTITGLAAGKSYTFRVKAKKGKVLSDASASVTVQTLN